MVAGGVAARGGGGLSALHGLSARILVTYRLALNGFHGPAHWLRVRSNALCLAAATPGADAAVAEYFALFHDGWREDEDHDPQHGERAAAQVGIFAAEGLLPLAAAQIATLAAACAGHNHPQVSADATIGCCWDADRLDLSRLHIRPRAERLSTAAALDPTLQAQAWTRGVKDVLDHEGLAAWGLSTKRSQFR